MYVEWRDPEDMDSAPRRPSCCNFIEILVANKMFGILVIRVAD